MEVRYMFNNSEADRIGKSLTLIETRDNKLLEETNMLNVMLKYKGSNPPQANYMYIPEFHRYYFITDITNLRNGLWSISGHVDVLETYKNEIKAQTGIVGRNEFKYNLMLPDDRITVEQKTQIQKLSYDTDVLNRNHILLMVAVDTEA